MDSIVENLGLLGLKEYEARVYVALAGIGETNARRIHEASGVPRPRVYDILQSLAARGYIEVRQGSPLQYRAVSPDVVISHLKANLDRAAQESIETLESLSIKAGQQYSPIWYVKGDWSVGRHIEAIARGTTNALLLLMLSDTVIDRYADLLAEVGRTQHIKVLYPADYAPTPKLIPSVSSYQIGEIRDDFLEDILEKVFDVPLRREGVVFELECIFLADNRESMFVYTQNGERMAVVITLPFITCVQSKLFTRMLMNARPFDGSSRS